MTSLRWASTEEMLRSILPELEVQAKLGEGFGLTVDGLDDFRASVVAFRGEEAMNGLYRFDVVVSVLDHVEPSLRMAALGRVVHLRIGSPDSSPRVVHGIAAGVQMLAHRAHHTFYRVTLVPKLWLLGKTVDCRVFQDMTAGAIASELLREHGIVHVLRLARRYAQHRYVVQYEETDLAFLQRILAEEGIFLSFEHPGTVEELRETLARGAVSALGQELPDILAHGGEQSLADAGRRLAQPAALLQMAQLQSPGEILVLGDTTSAYGQIHGLSELVYDPEITGGALRVDERHVPLFAVRSAIEPTRATVRDYDPTRAQRPAAGTVIGTVADGLGGALADGVSAAVSALPDIGLTPPGGLTETVSHGILTATHAAAAPEIAIARSAIAVAGELVDPLLRGTPLAGAAGAAAEAARSALGGAEADLEIYEPHSAFEEAEPTFPRARTRLEQLRASHVECAGYSRSARLVPGTTFELRGHDLTAFNRRYALVAVVHEASASADDARRVYHNEFTCVPADVAFRPPPPGRRHLQTVESAVVVGPGREEIVTEHLGCVKVQFHWDRRGRHDDRSSCWIRVMQPWSGPQFGFQFIPRVGMEVLVSFVGGDPNRPVVIGCVPNLANAPPHALPQDRTRSGIRTRSSPESGGYNELMFDDAKDHESVLLRAQRNHEEQVLHDQLVGVGHDQTISVGGDRNETVGGSHTTRVAGGDVRRVGGDQATDVRGAATLTYGGERQVSIGGSDTQAVEGSRVVIVRGSHQLIVRAGGEGPAVSSQVVDGHHTVSASGDVHVLARERLHLSVGRSTIQLDADGITLRGPRIVLQAEEDVVLRTDQGTLSVSDDAITLASKEVDAHGEGASMLLDGDARLNGARVLLNCEGDDPTRPPGDGDEGSGQVRFHVEPPEGTSGPLTFVIATPTGEVVERTGNADNEVTLEGRPGQSFTLIDVRRGGVSLGVTLPDDGEEG